MSEPFTPHPYQMKGLEIMKQASLGLFLDPGLGKTSTWLAAFTTLKELGFVDKMLVVAPLKPMYDTWPKEIEKWAEFEHLTWCFLHGPDKDWHLENTDADVYLINPEGLQWLTSKCEPNTLADVLCVDESTKFKNAQSKRFKAMKHFWPKFLYRWIGTGTPAPKGLMDLFAQMYILDGGNALGGYITHYRNKWFHTQPWDEYTYIPNDNAYEEITDAIAPLVLVMEAEDYLDMPELQVVDKYVTLPPKALNLYKELEKEFVATVPDTTSVLVAPSVAAAGEKCRQIANGAVYTEVSARSKAHEFEVIHDEKLDMLDELLEEIGEHPVLVVYEFQHDLSRITRRHLDWPCLTGMTGEVLQHMTSKFNDGKIPRLLIQSSQAHGLNIQSGAHHMIWYGLTWNWEDYKQMVDRLYRQGQCSNMVMVYRILADATLDIDIAKRLKEKYETETDIKRRAKQRREKLEPQGL